jgi:basic membrane protein A
MNRRSGIFRSTVAASVVMAAVAGCSAAGGGTNGDDCGIAFVHRDPIGSEQTSQDIQNGLLRGAHQTGAKIRTIEASGPQSLNDNLSALAAKRCYSAIGTAYVVTDQTVAKAAKTFPKQHFFTVQGTAAAANVTDYTDDPSQVSFVAGAMAARATKTKTVGVVLGMNLPPVRLWKNGFEQGVHFIDPSVKVLTGYVGSFTDPAKSATVAVNQSAQDADLIFAASGADLEISRQGATHKYRTIITNSSEYKQAAARHDVIAFAAVEDMGNIALGAVQDLRGSAPAKGTRTFGFTQSVFAVTDLTSKIFPASQPVPADVVAAGRRAYQGLVSGQVSIKNPTQ